MALAPAWAQAGARHHASERTLTIGTLYASSGTYAVSSLAELAGLKFWAARIDAHGGVYVHALRGKARIRIAALNDQSSTSLATTLYTDLMTEQHVNLLVADFGSVLTSVGLPIAQEHHMVLWDPTGTSSLFFDHQNPDVVLLSGETASVEPDPLAAYIEARHLSRVAIVFDENDFAEAQAVALKARLAHSGSRVVAYLPVPTTTDTYTVLAQSLSAKRPQAVVELGYDQNDLAFLQALAQGGHRFPLVFTVFSGEEFALFRKDLGTPGLANTYTYATPPLLAYRKVNLGLSQQAFVALWSRTHDLTAPDYLNVAGYNAGLILQAVLGHSPSLAQAALRRTAQMLSGRLETLDGTFRITPSGAQVGDALGVSQFQVHRGRLTPVVVFPYTRATGVATAVPGPGVSRP